MKKSFLALTSACLAGLLLCASACGVSPKTPNENSGDIGGQEADGANMLASFRGKISPLTYAERKSEEFISLHESAESFAATFAGAANAAYTQDENFAVAPLSVYMALSLAAQTAAGDTKEELLAALGTDADSLRRDYSALYRSLEAEYRTSEYEGNKLVGCVDLSNSVWVNDGVPAKKECLDVLANDFYCSSYSADFTFDNASANRAVRAFVKEQTRALIDRDFSLSERTVFALINTLYLKDVWNTSGFDLPFTTENIPFANADGTKTDEKLLMGQYSVGQKVETDRYTHFYIRTANDYKLKFILPKDGCTAKELCTAEVLAEVNAISEYNGIDEAANTRYHTRCLFPEFTAAYSGSVIPILKETFGIEALFSPSECDLSAMTDEDAYCSDVTHVTQLNVDKTGVEGAAVTIMMNEATATPPIYNDVYEDFLVDRAFVFILTDRYDTTLFSGIVNRV